jgi:hypothetical protein
VSHVGSNLQYLQNGWEYFPRFYFVYKVFLFNVKEEAYLFRISGVVLAD